RMAESFIQSGFQISFEPDLTSLGSVKIPDLGLTDADGTFYLELADMHPSHDATVSDRMGLGLSIAVMENTGELLYSGRIFKTLSKPRQSFAIEEMRKAAEKA